MKKPHRIKKIITGVFVTLGIMIGCPFIFVFLSKFSIYTNIKEMHQPHVYQQIAKEMAVYCQSLSEGLPTKLGRMALSKIARDLEIHTAWFQEDSGVFVTGGGWHHYGYRIEKIPHGPTSPPNTWTLFFIEDEAAPEELYSFTVSPRKKLTMTEFVSSVVSAYDDAIHHEKTDLRVHQSKIRFLLTYSTAVEARHACEILLQSLPDNWWANLINALILTKRKTPEAAEQFLVNWVQRTPGFFSYLDLAYYYQLQDQPGKATQSMLKATEYQANTWTGHGGNAEYRGYNAAMYAYEHGEYEAVISLCNKLLPLRINGDFAKEGLNALKKAAEKQLQNIQVSQPGSGRISAFEPFKNIDLDKLLSYE